MATKNNRLIEGLVLAVIVGSFYLVIQPFNEANALSRPTVATGFNNVQFTKFIPSSSSPTQRLAVGNFSGTDTSNHGGSKINVYNANSTGLIGSFNFAQALRSGLMNGYTFDNISCDKTGSSGLCAIGLSSATTNSEVIMVDMVNQISSTNATRFLIASGLTPVVSLFNDGSKIHIYTEFDDSGALQTHVLKLAINSSQSIATTSNRLVQQADVISNVRVTGIGNSDTAIVNNGAIAGQYIGFMNGGSFQLWSISTASRICGVNLPGGGNAGDIDYVSDSTGQYFLASDQTTTLEKIDFSCNLVVSSVFGAGQVGTGIHSISHSGNRQEVYIIGSNNLIQVVNETSLSTTALAQYGSVVSPGINFNNLATESAYGNGYQANNPFVVLGGGGNPATLFFFFWQLGSGVGGGGAGGGNTCGAVNPKNCVGQVNCELPANANLVMCFTNNNNSTNAFNGGTQVINNTGSVIAQGIGLTNLNMKTNGVGYLFLFLSLIIGNALWLLIVHNFGTKGIVVPQPIYVSVLISFSIIMAFVVMGFTDPLILIIGVVVTIAFVAPKAITMIRGSEPVST